jgi:hypothetical protein
LLGEADICVDVGNLSLPCRVLVSNFVSEPMLGSDWLMRNRCKWSFHEQEVEIDGRVFSVQARSAMSACRPSYAWQGVRNSTVRTATYHELGHRANKEEEWNSRCWKRYCGNSGQSTPRSQRSTCGSSIAYHGRKGEMSFKRSGDDREGVP